MLLEKLLPIRSCGLCASLSPKKKLASDEENFKFNHSIVKPNDEPEEVEEKQNNQ